MTSLDDLYKKEIEHILKEEFSWYLSFLEELFDFNRFGFHKIYSGPVPNSHPTIVYESKICRVRFIWEVRTDVRVRTETTHILYSRLHAPTFQRIMDWQGEKCYCWHSIDKVLSFLDGLTPLEAFNTKAPFFMWNFYEKNRGLRQAEREARMHIAAWEQYGQSLFDVFDINRPDLWQQYVDFVKGYYTAVPIWEGTAERPPLYKIC